MNGYLEKVESKTNFGVKCIDALRTKTLTKSKKYKVLELGFNGYFKVKGDTNRFVWHNPSRFNKIKK